MQSRKNQIEEHILVCLSSAPSNAKLIRTAAKMADAFRGEFTAIYVETSSFSNVDEENKKRLRSNMHLAKQMGAKIEIVYGEDVPLQIAEYARLSGVTKIVIGRSAATRRQFILKQTLTERLIQEAPNMDVYIIPDNDVIGKYHEEKEKSEKIFSIFDILKCIGILTAVSLIGTLFEYFGISDINIITIYILGVLVTSIATRHQIYSIITSLLSVIVFNFLFTYPRYTLLAYDNDYPVTFLIMLSASFITSSLATKLKQNARQSARTAFRTKVLFETNQLLQQAKGREEIIKVTAQQLMKLLSKSMIIYLTEGEELSEPYLFPVNKKTLEKEYLSERERHIAKWVKEHNRHAGATTDTFSDSRCLYYAIRKKDAVYGVAGIVMDEVTVYAFENSILLSILGECALALENEKNAREKEEAAILAKREQLRANLLRTISHDLRTPLTSISGNASNLLSNGEYFDENVKKQLYSDIYEDSMWLINLVENLLSVTRLEEGNMNLHMEAQLLEDVINEALRHVDRKIAEHTITVEYEDDLMLVRMDAKLIVQVLINIVDNAIKYTPKNSKICIRAYKRKKMAVISVADDGVGIPDEQKPYVFDMFYSGANEIADSRRSMGIGLALCKSIVAAHGGTITVADNEPSGTEFRFTLPIEEVQLHE